MKIFQRPANQFVAGFIGSPRMNFIDVLVTDFSDGRATVCSDSIHPVTIKGDNFTIGERAVLGVRPQHLRPANDAEHGGTISGTISLIERLGTETIVSFDTKQSERILSAIPDDVSFGVGEKTEFCFNPQSAHLFPAS
jgi:multiple sugar transport system ATP-binding protein